MGVASLVIGIVALFTAFLPLIGATAILPALVGLGLGLGHVVSAKQRQQPRGMGVAGVVLNGLAIVVVAGWLLLIGLFGQMVGESVQMHGGSFTTTPAPAQPAPAAVDPKFKPMMPVDEPVDTESAP